ncbi:MAG TPA: NAD(P)-dependent oxidoreductase [Alphaproteobacteria bacterium]|nr:hypothetical protein [Rhodospirillaceae bacterium]HRJ12088.1 NAD(P)-dependent oxidoreductase [Alphaproteobacteria bacterium]
MTARIAVTGANGFLGSEICAALKDFHVTALVRRNADCERLKKISAHAEINFLDDDWSNVGEALATTKPDVTIHAAAAMDGGDDIKAARNLATVNILQPTLLLAAAKAVGCKGFVTVGTAWQHWDDSDYNPMNLYAASKQAFDDILRYYGESGMAAVTVHMCDTYGLQDPRSKLIQLLFHLARSGETLAMTPGQQEIDLVHVSDAAEAYAGITKKILSGEISGFNRFDISGGAIRPLKQLVGLMEKVTGKTLSITWGGKDYRPREMMHARRRLTLPPGWLPVMELEKGLTQVWQEKNS